MSLLQYKNVSMHFGGLRATDNVSFEVKENEIVGLIGPNGAGKTTLFAMASGFLSPTHGQIWFRDKRIDRLTAPDICEAGLVRTYQIVRPFGEMTVLENVMIGAFLHCRSTGRAREQAMRVVERVGLGPRAAQVAHTLTLAGRKRLEVAKALATQPKLLLLDEVMAGLNVVEITEMLDLVRSLRDDGVSVLVIEHNMQAIMRLSDRIIVVHHGQKIADGEPEQVASSAEVIAAYLGDQYKGHHAHA
ncbi:ABC transporter ATP-binding protein [Alcaligenaceae bacterium CGII-47]|nr:ABC transporter ATP-binding protein [Alcaligenaceae bacterium CGII-47]